MACQCQMSNVKSKSSNIKCQIILSNREVDLVRSQQIMLYYNQIVQIRLAHRLYTGFQHFLIFSPFTTLTLDRYKPSYQTTITGKLHKSTQATGRIVPMFQVVLVATMLHFPKIHTRQNRNFFILTLHQFGISENTKTGRDQ